MMKAFKDYPGAKYRNMVRKDHHKRELSYSTIGVGGPTSSEQPMGAMASNNQYGQKFSVHGMKGPQTVLSPSQAAEKLKFDVEAMTSNLKTMLDRNPGFFLGFVVSLLMVCFLVKKLTKRSSRKPRRTRVTWIALTEMSGASTEDKFCLNV